MTDDVEFVADSEDKWSLGTASWTFHGVVDLSSRCLGSGFLNIKTSIEPDKNTLKMFAAANWFEKKYVLDAIEVGSTIPMLQKIDGYLFGKYDREIAVFRH
jgi:hypothetical protein